MAVHTLTDRKVWGSLRDVSLLLLLCGFLAWLGLSYPGLVTGSSTPAGFPFGGTPSETGESPHPLIELLKLACAAAIGVTISAIHKRFKPEKALTRSMEQSLTLLCVTGAMMMIIIGSSLPRALGIAGGAGIIRFRTPVKDAKDATVFFLLLGLGMACGIGAFAVAGLGTLFVAVLLFALDRFGEPKPRNMWLQVVSAAPEFPFRDVRNVFAGYRVHLEARQWTSGPEPTVRFAASLAFGTPVEEITKSLMNAGGVKSVAWEPARKQKDKDDDDDDWF